MSVRSSSRVGTTPSMVVEVILEYERMEILVPVPEGNQKVVPGPKAHQLSKSVLRIKPLLPVWHHKAAARQCG